MAAYIARRLLQGALTMLGVAVLVFGLLHLSGDPALVMSSPDATPEQIDQLRHELGLDRPLPVQLGLYLGRLAQGDLGQSLRFNRSVTGLILERLPNTLELTLAAMLVAVAVALPSGIAAAIHRGERLDRLLMAGALAGQAKIVSVTTAPPKSCASCRPSSVTIGMAAVRSACTTSTRHSARPFARAVRI